MAKIESPVPGFTGVVVGVTFTEGHAETTNPSALGYFRRHGYIINGTGPANQAPPPDSRDITDTKVGAPLRDAAVDPRPADFLAPTNAGHADPHGPALAAPGIHGTPPGPPRPGKVSDDPKIQEIAETAQAARVLGVDAPPPDPYAAPAEPASAADTPAEAAASTPDVPTADELVEANTKDQLVAMAASAGVEVTDAKATKAVIAEAIVAARDKPTETPAAETHGPTPVVNAATAVELEEAHTKPELFDLADQAGVVVPKKATKAEVAEAIVAART